MDLVDYKTNKKRHEIGKEMRKMLEWKLKE